MPFPYSLPLVLPTGTAPSETPVDPLPTEPTAVSLAVSNHQQVAVTRLLEQFKAQPIVVASVESMASPMQSVENGAWSLETERIIDTAVGPQLENFGAIVGQQREQFDDEDYRRYVRARVRLNVSSGTIPEIIGILEILLEEGQTLRFLNEFPAGFTIWIEGAEMSSVLASKLAAFIKKARAGGVRAILSWGESPPEELFRFDVGPGLDVGKLAGSSLA
jgi:hypothetical protein